MQDTWIVCYFGIALGLDERIINSFRFLNLFELRTCRLLFEKITTKLHARYWAVKPSPVHVGWTYCLSPTGYFSIEMGYVYMVNPIGITVERHCHFRLQREGKNLKIYKWKPGYKITQSGLPVTVSELEIQILAFINYYV